MVSGLSDADRVLAICTNLYVEKANNGVGGVGYEKMILTAQVMRDIKSKEERMDTYWCPSITSVFAAQHMPHAFLLP